MSASRTIQANNTNENVSSPKIQDPNNKNPILPSNSVVSNFLESLGLPTVFLPYSTSDRLSKSSDDINQLKNGTKLDLRATFDFG